MSFTTYTEPTIHSFHICLSSNVLVYRLGGTTMDVTLFEVKSGMYRVLSSAYSDHSAGTEITKSLVKYFATEFKRYGQYISFN